MTLSDLDLFLEALLDQVEKVRAAKRARIAQYAAYYRDVISDGR